MGWLSRFKFLSVPESGPSESLCGNSASIGRHRGLWPKSGHSPQKDAHGGR